MSRARVLPLLLALACRAPGPDAPAAAAASSRATTGWNYRVDIGEGAKTIAASVCFAGAPPETLEVLDDDAERNITDIRVLGRDAPLALDDGAVALTDVQPGECVAWSVDLVAMGEALGARSVSWLGDSVALKNSMWLLWPGDAPDDAEIGARISAPPDVQVSLPWQVLTRRDGVTTHRLDVTVSRWLGYLALGRLHRQQFVHDGVDVDLVRLDGQVECDDVGLRAWIVDAIDSVALLYGRFPRDRLQVLVVPQGRGGGPVYFGAAYRGGGPGVILLLDAAATAERLPGGWTTVHELLHHGMPFVDDAWMGEGFVSYYTEIMRTRMGHRSEAEGWRELHEAFARGAEGGRGLTLRATSDHMFETHAFQRVYWGGAAIGFEIDLRLRLATGNARGLDDAVKQLRACCGDRKRTITATRALAELDRWYGEPLFTEIAERHLASRDFADIDALFAELGVRVDAGEVVLDDRHPNAAIRRAIMAPR